MVRPVVLALLCWFAVSVPVTLILARLMGALSKTLKVPALSPAHGAASDGPPATAVERDELAAAERLAEDLEPIPL